VRCVAGEAPQDRFGRCGADVDRGRVLDLDFDLLPRIKQINKIKLYRPDRGDPQAFPELGPAMTRPILRLLRWYSVPVARYSLTRSVSVASPPTTG